jgi:hypothetical protein
LRQNGGRSAKNQSELPQKAKVKCHKKPKSRVVLSRLGQTSKLDGAHCSKN